MDMVSLSAAKPAHVVLGFPPRASFTRIDATKLCSRASSVYSRLSFNGLTRSQTSHRHVRVSAANTAFGSGNGKQPNEETEKVEGDPHLKYAWAKLSYQKRDGWYSYPFYSRCMPKQFAEVCRCLKNKQDVMKKLKEMGFDKLVDVCCLYRHLNFWEKLMHAFQPQSKQILIRGRTVQMSPKDVHEFLGLPYGGKQIDVDMFNEDDQVLKDYKTKYGQLKYTQIAPSLKEMNVNDENFEFLFVLYTLGTFICPDSNVCVSDRLLKITLLTINAVADYDWSSFVLNELCNSIEAYQIQYQIQLIMGNAKGMKYVGGCLYFLMIFVLQNFPLGEYVAPSSKDALAYWDDKKVRARVAEERYNLKGLYWHVQTPEMVSARLPQISQLSKVLDYEKSTLLHVQTQTMNTIQESNVINLEIKRIHERLMSIIGFELMSLQSKLLGGNENYMERDEDDSQSREEDEEGDEEGSDLKGDEDE